MATHHKTGGDVDAYCNKCKLVLAHIIIAMDGSKLVRVECKTCKAVHAYKKSAGTAKGDAKKSPRASRAAAAKNGVGPANYDELLKGRDLSRAQRYRTSVSYAEGDVLDHTTFGMGIIIRLLADDKIEVLFPAALKVLVHAREAAKQPA